ncbi:MAG: tetratricopeptide repeat protein, partial [Candidatus Hydrogenedentota bacterium]
DPYSPEAHNNLGFIYMESKEYDRAIEQFQLTIAVYPDPFNPPPPEVFNVARAFYNIGLANQGKGSFESALRAYEKAVRVAPRLAEAYSNMGTVYISLGRYQDAMREFRKGLSINPDLELAKRNLEILDRLMKEYEAGTTRSREN